MKKGPGEKVRVPKNQCSKRLGPNKTLVQNGCVPTNLCPKMAEVQKGCVPNKMYSKNVCSKKVVLQEGCLPKQTGFKKTVRCQYVVEKGCVPKRLCSKKAVFQNCNFVCEAPQELNRRLTRFLASEKVAQGGEFRRQRTFRHG